MKNNKHVFLINEKAENPNFKRKRGWKNKDIEEPIDTPQPKFIKDFQKERFRADIINFYAQKKLRTESRQIQFPKNIELVRIFFHTVFNLDLIRKFEERYGLSPISFSHFNKTVIFEIIDEKLFLNFEKHIGFVIESPDEATYENQPFNLIALILKFEFIGSNYRLLTSRERGILLTLISSSNVIYKNQKDTLFQFLEKEKFKFSYNSASPDIIEIESINKSYSKYLTDNFDIIRMITSTRALKVRPGEYGEVRREYGFNIEIPDKLTLVGIIDTGITRIDPLKELIVAQNYDHSEKGAFWDEIGHGTMVAGLVALGDDFQKEIKDSYTAKAKIVSIKALHFTDDGINIPQLLLDIKDARRNHGVRLFNFSLNIPSAKLYNDSYSQFAYELDKLAFEEDILLFISVGNFDSNSLYDLVKAETHPDHDYPTFFYNLNGTSQIHRCQNTNILEPSESLNNISIGALAGNLENADKTDLTPNNLSPAYYTRKFHFDYTQSVNKQPLRKNQNNKHLNKPDLVFDGGDLFEYSAGIEILRAPHADGEKYYGRSCGTSLAAPLVASYASEILNIYPKLRTQTVKALLINSATFSKKSNLPEFRNSTEAVLKSLVGFGKPQKSHILTTEDNSIVFIVEDEIEVGQILTIPIILPEYLKKAGNKLKFDISLCYSFMPIRENHLNYLPLHISFNLVKNTDIKTVAEKDQVDYGIKPGFSWSEDHHGIENRIFSNAQNKSYNLQTSDLISVGNSIALGVRCLAKSEIPAYYDSFLKGVGHKFSIIIRATEIEEIISSNSLYLEMINCNEILNIVESDATIEI